MPILALFDSSSEINAIHSIFVQELRLSIRSTDVEVQKIDGTTLDTYKIIVAVVSVTNKANQVRFFEKTFLVANVSPKVVFGMFFLILSSINVNLTGQKLYWRTYTTKKVFSTTIRIELGCKKGFVTATLDPESEIFVIHVASLSFIALSSFFPLELDIYPSYRPQISGLIIEEASTKVPVKYSDFADVFSPDLGSRFLEHTRINNCTIKLVNGQQPSYIPIYSLEPVELEILKAYIETNLANGFIKLSKSFTSAPNLFDWKSGGFL